jgi:hypothetical protein
MIEWYNVMVLCLCALDCSDLFVQRDGVVIVCIGLQ